MPSAVAAAGDRETQACDDQDTSHAGQPALSQR